MTDTTSQSTAIVPVGKNANLTFEQVCTLAAHAVKAQMFPDLASASLAIMKIMAGQEFGFGPFASLDGIRIIKGRPSMSATMMAALVQRTGVYDYRVIELDDAHCMIYMYKGGEKIGESEFTIDDAKAAGVFSSNPTWQKYPRNMLLARAMSNAVRWYCPSVLSGASMYVAEELSDGEAFDEDSIPQIQKPADPATPDLYMDYEKACAMAMTDGRVFGEMEYRELISVDANLVKFIKNNGKDPRVQGAIDRHEAIRSIGYFQKHPEMIEVQKKLLAEREANQPVVQGELVEEETPDTIAEVRYEDIPHDDNTTQS